MARLNTRTSATPQATRSSTADSLYRDPTPGARLQTRIASSARHSSYSVASPAPSSNSDKENQVPTSRDSTPKPLPKGNRAMGAPRLPTPVSGSTSGLSSGHSSKRRRTGDYSIAASSPTFRDNDSATPVDEDARSLAEHDAHEEDEGDEDEEDEDDTTKFYDPQQDPELRRQLRANIRQNHRDMEDNRDELIKPDNSLLLDHMKKQDYYMGKVKQTADAALDSRAMVLASDLANRKINNSLNGSNGVGIDVDQFVSRCIFFMTSGGETAGRGDTNARGRRGPAVSEDDEEDNGDGLDWAVLGREACFPCTRRPPVSSFLLGPLSVQKRARATQTRRARSQRQPLGPATRPQELTESDMQQSENSNLTSLVTSIRQRMENHINTAMEQVENEVNELNESTAEPDPQASDIACRRHRVQLSKGGGLGVSLFDFAVNPISFGQTVENLFYVSFLIREGHASVEEDANGLPLLLPSEPFSLQEQRERKIEKHQAVFRIDWPTWKDLIEAFDIQEPLIPHRVEEETDVAAGGWYG